MFKPFALEKIADLEIPTGSHQPILEQSIFDAGQLPNFALGLNMGHFAVDIETSAAPQFFAGDLSQLIAQAAVAAAIDSGLELSTHQEGGEHAHGMEAKLEVLALTETLRSALDQRLVGPTIDNLIDFVADAYGIDADAVEDNFKDALAEMGAEALSSTVNQGPTDTVPGDSSTTVSVAIGGQVSGTRNTSNDSDWYQVDLVAGQTYTFLMLRDGVNPHEDPLLQLIGTDGVTVLAENDDIDSTGDGFSDNRNSGITFTATTTGTHYLNASGWSVTTGDYTIFAELGNNRPDFTNDEAAFFLTHQFDNAASWASNTVTYDISALSAGAQTLALLAMEAWAEVSGLTLVAAAGGGTADITFNEDRSVDDPETPEDETGQATAFASFNNVAGNLQPGIVTISDNWDLDAFGDPNYDLNSYRYQTYLHEIGHALGLGHSGPYNGGATYATSRAFNQDSWATTVMSYFDQGESSYGTPRLVLGLQIVDLIAIQSIYGANAGGTRGGDTVYGFNVTADVLNSVFDFENTFDSNGIRPPSISIYDTGGVDTLDVSGWGTNQIVDMNQETFSSVGDNFNTGDTTDPLIGNLSIARGTDLENVITGSGNDIITGNALDNTITGGAGDNIIDGADGNDIVIFVGASTGYTITDNGDGTTTITHNTTGDANILSNVETAAFSDQNVNLAATGPTFTEGDDNEVGTEGDDYLDALGGDDTVSGLGGNDIIFGRAGNDTLNGDAGNDELNGDEGADMIDGGSDDDLIHGGDDNDNIVGGLGNDTIYGDAGDDFLNGGAGDDSIYGGVGHDTLIGGGNADVLRGGVGNDTILGGNGNDRLLGQAGNDILDGGAGNDDIFGGTGQNTIDGGAGNDNIFGDVDIDILTGGLGDDSIRGYAGNDTIYGNEGVDFLRGEEGDDLIEAGDGKDRVEGGDGNDDISGGLGNDVLLGNLGIDEIYGDDGNDQIFGGGDNDTLYGGNGIDRIVGGTGDDFLRGEADNDRLTGEDGDDRLLGDAGDDDLFGGAGMDEMFGGDGADLLVGGDGIDTMFGEAGADIMGGGLGNDVMRGNDDNDKLKGDGGDDYIRGDAGDDRLEGGTGEDLLLGGLGDDDILGGADNDTIGGGDGADYLLGQDGDDTINGDAGADRIIGGNGNDTIRGNADNDLLYGGAGDDFLRGDDGADRLEGNAGIDRLDGGAGNDDIFGGNDDDVLLGRDGNDDIFGDAGNDTIYGGLGSDRMTGGTGNDTFEYVEGDGYDRILDFEITNDVVNLVGTSFNSFVDIQAAMIDHPGYVLLDMGNGSILRFEGLTSADFVSTNFTIGGSASNELKDDITIYVSEPMDLETLTFDEIEYFDDFTDSNDTGNVQTGTEYLEKLFDGIDWSAEFNAQDQMLDFLESAEVENYDIFGL